MTILDLILYFCMDKRIHEKKKNCSKVDVDVVYVSYNRAAYLLLKVYSIYYIFDAHQPPFNCTYH